MIFHSPTKRSRPVSSQPDMGASPGQDGRSASEIAQAVKSGKLSALGAVEAALSRSGRYDSTLNAVADITAERARARAREIDAAVAAGKNSGPLAGVPFAVK